MIRQLAEKFNKCLSRKFSALNYDAVSPNLAKILIFKSHDVYLNLATEEFLFEKVKNLVPTLLIYQNDKTVVIGKHQNPWKECNLPEMRKNSVKLARRLSGGGAVYHDLGNTCFSFMDPLSTVPQNIDFKDINTKVIEEALQSLGLPAKTSPRHDVRIYEKKVSGSAYKFKPRNRTLHL